MPDVLPVSGEQRLPVAQGLVLIRDEVPLACPAHWAEPGVRNVLEGRASGNAAIGVALVGIVDVAAGFADPALQGLGGAHRRKAYTWARGDMFIGVTGEEAVPQAQSRRPSASDAVTRPGPGQRLNTGPETTPRQAATVILLRGDTGALEVLLVQRSPQARFMGGVWVFPGGAVDRDEQGAKCPHALAARRELREEASIVLAEDAELIEFSRWITPAVVEIRYDTIFFLAQLPDGQEASVDGSECIAHRWYAPSKALSAYEADELPLVFPTVKHLEELVGFSNVAELIEHARGRPIGPIQPKVIMESGTPRIVLPGEPGY